jgi:hypothetical protein
MHRRFLLPAALALATAFALGACSASGSSPAPSPSVGTPTTMSMAPSNSPGASPASAATAPADATTVHVLDFKIQPAALTLKGPAISLFVVNDGPTVHNVTIRDASGKVLMATPDLRAGETALLQGDLKPGTYVTFCSLPGHESLGTKGTLTITG